MSVMGSAADGLLGALVTGLIALLLWFLGRGNNEQKRTAWQAQAEKLRDELRRVYEDRDADKDRQIQYLQGQGTAKDNEIERKAAEIRRLNKLLNSSRRGGND